MRFSIQYYVPLIEARRYLQVIVLTSFCDES